MTPNPNLVTNKVSSQEKHASHKNKREKIFLRMDKPFYLEQHVFHLFWLGIPHLFAIYYSYLQVTGHVPHSTLLFEIVYAYFGGFGITIGCHRYWTHKTFKAKLPLQILLMIMQTSACQHPIHKWCLDHRIHHKYTDTNADPHNSKRGFWYSHMGWLFLPKHPDVQEKLKTCDMSDLERDPVVRFQSRWYYTLTWIFHVIIPISVFCYVWNLPFLYGFSANCRKYVILLHLTWSVNSLAHIWGDRPHDKSISASENRFVSLLAVGEGWHNFHHLYPCDYRTSEFGWKINASAMLIDFFAWIGWAHDLKTVSQKMINDRKKRTGNEMKQLSSLKENDDGIDDEFNHELSSDVEISSIGEGFWE